MIQRIDSSDKEAIQIIIAFCAICTISLSRTNQCTGKTMQKIKYSRDKMPHRYVDGVYYYAHEDTPGIFIIYNGEHRLVAEYACNEPETALDLFSEDIIQ